LILAFFSEWQAAYETRGDCYSCSLEKIFDIPVKSPFIPSFNFFTSQFHPISLSSGLFVVSQPFLMQIDLQAGSDHPFLIMETQLCLNTLSDKGDLVATCLGSTANSSKQHAITKNEEFSFWYSLVSSVSGDEVSLGKIRVQWRRPASLLSSFFEISIPVIKISTAPFSVKIDSPPYAVAGSLIPFTIAIQNHTDLLQEFSLNVHENPSFLFSGEKQSTSFNIHPRSSYVLKHNLLPLSSGKQQLPYFQITSKRFQKELPQTKQPHFIFINPSKEPIKHTK